MQKETNTHWVEAEWAHGKSVITAFRCWFSVCVCVGGVN